MFLCVTPGQLGGALSLPSTANRPVAGKQMGGGGARHKTPDFSERRCPQVGCFVGQRSSGRLCAVGRTNRPAQLSITGPVTAFHLFSVTLIRGALKA